MQKIENILLKNDIKIYGVVDFDESEIVFYTKRSKYLNQTYKSTIIMAFPYYSEQITDGNISCYAAVNDYHKVIKVILDDVVADLQSEYKEEKFLIFIDSSPIAEVKTAAKAGLGVIGKHGLLITKEYGTYVFLASIITTLKLRPTYVDLGECYSCNLCIKACPTSVIMPNKVIDEKRCLSHITQKKGSLTKEEEEIIKDNKTVWGCDICQKVCPHNKNIKNTYIDGFLNGVIKDIDEDIIHRLYKSRAFGFRGKLPLLRNLKLLEEL